MAGRAERLGRAALENYSTTPLFNTKAVVRQTGVPAPTLRAWERRYGVLRPYRGENDYRLYSERDIAIIRWLREEVENGLTISQAIALLRSLTSGPTTASELERSAGSAPDLDQPDTVELLRPEAARTPKTTSAAHTNQVEQFQEQVKALLLAFNRLDEASASRILARAFAMFTVEQVVAFIIQPALFEIGTGWADGETTITSEHFATALLRSQLEALYRSEPAERSGPLILVGCAPGEYHELGPLALALLLRRLHRGLRVTYLGQNVEPAHLIESVQTLRPAIVCLSAALEARSQAIAEVSHRLAGLPTVQRPHLIFGGQAFLHNPTTIDEIEGTFLNSSAVDASFKIQQLALTSPSGQR